MKDAPDVVVIGSGAGGGTMAWALARRGVKVLLLEAGPAYDPANDYLLDRDNWEQKRFPAKIPTKGRQIIAPLQSLDARWADLRSWNRIAGRYNRGDRRQSWGYHHVVGLGGSTLQFTGEAHRLHPAAMRMRSRFGVGADWPLDYAELEPFYLEAERVIGVAGPRRDERRWRSAPYPLAPHRMSYASQRIGEGCRKLGLEWTENALASLSAPYDGRPDCNYCGNCQRGCPRLDKGSIDVTLLRRARASGNCTILTGARVLAIEAGADERIKSVRYLVGGKPDRVAARAVVLACGAVETPRLLLASTGKFAERGLANESGQVGRNFMETLSWKSTGLHPEPLGSHRGHPTDGICWSYNAPDAIPGIVGGCRFSPGMAEADLVGPINHAKRVVGGWGRAHKRQMRETFGRVLSVGAIGEFLPGPKSFIDLDPEARDDAGVAKARIHSHLDDNALRRLAFMAKTARAILEAAGIDRLVEEYGSYDTFSATHVFGTCRMGDDAATSVVDRWCRSHRWRNLFVVDASVFPSSGGGEAPSLTIEALALRTAGRMVAAARKGEL